MVAEFGRDGRESSFSICFRCLDCDVDGGGGGEADSPSEPEEAVDGETCFTVELPDD